MDNLTAPPGDTSVQAGHEIQDVRPSGVLWLGGALLIVAIVVHLLLWWLFDKLSARAEQVDPPIPPLAREVGPPPGPQLEQGLTYRTAKKAAEEKLSSYGWVDKQQGVVHIPIERAEQVLLERGLPEPSGPVQPAESKKEDNPSQDSTK